MTDQGLHALNQSRRSPIERFFWLWLLIAFVVGLIPGLGLWWYQRTVANARAEQQIQRVLMLNAKVNDQAKQIAKLTSQATSAQANAVAGGGGGGSAAGGGSSSATANASAPPPGQITFVSSSVTPDPATAAGPIKITVVIAGGATDAYLQLKSTAGYKIWRLKPGAKSGTTTTWARDDAIAPKTADQYTVITWAFVGSKRFVMKPSTVLTVK